MFAEPAITRISTPASWIAQTTLFICRDRALQTGGKVFVIINTRIIPSNYLHIIHYRLFYPSKLIEIRHFFRDRTEYLNGRFRNGKSPILNWQRYFSSGQHRIPFWEWFVLNSEYAISSWQSLVFTTRNVLFSYRKASFPVGNPLFSIGNSSFPHCRDSCVLSYAIRALCMGSVGKMKHNLFLTPDNLFPQK